MTIKEKTVDRFGNERKLPDNIEAKGDINPETNKPWVFPKLAGIHDIFTPFIVYTDLPQGCDSEEDQSLFWRSFKKGVNLRIELVINNPGTIPRSDSLFLRMAKCWDVRKSELTTILDNVWARNPFLEDNIKILNFTLGQRNFDLSHALFSNVHSSTLCEGMQQGFQAEFWIRNFNIMVQKHGRVIHDRILSFAEYVGAINNFNPEQISDDTMMPIDDIMHRVNDKFAEIGLDNLKLPTYQGGLIGVSSAYGLIDDRMLYSLYVALKIRDRFKHKPNAAICDLGAGNGLVIFWLYQMGFRNLYTVDLPHISLMQAHQLACHFGENEIRLTGEKNKAPIQIMSMEEFFNHKFDLVVNADSLPEIDSTWVEKYLNHINHSCKVFYSINHESTKDGQLPVRSSVNKHAPNLHCTSRNRFWMRPGYVEEWYERLE